MNELKNGFPLEVARHRNNHPNYSNRVQSALIEIKSRLGSNPDPNLAAEEFRALITRIENAIRTQAPSIIDDVIF